VMLMGLLDRLREQRKRIFDTVSKIIDTAADVREDLSVRERVRGDEGSIITGDIIRKRRERRWKLLGIGGKK